MNDDAKLTIEAGKRYVTRGGWVTPALKMGINGAYVAYQGERFKSWNLDGSYDSSVSNCWDLLSEYSEPQLSEDDQDWVDAQAEKGQGDGEYLACSVIGALSATEIEARNSAEGYVKNGEPAMSVYRVHKIATVTRTVTWSDAKAGEGQ